jgi:hypothetical protein
MADISNSFYRVNCDNQRLGQRYQHFFGRREITTRFILKALSILVVAAVIFGYYLDDVRKESPAKSAKYFAWISGVIILAAVIGAFFIVGSPMTARLIQFDQQKVSDLQNIQYQVVNYWQTKQKLPNSLSDLTDSIYGYTMPIDQQKNIPYEYTIKDAAVLSFELCATFNKPSENTAGLQRAPAPYPSDGKNQIWDHASGRVCFERTIDKYLYPPLSTSK